MLWNLKFIVVDVAHDTMLDDDGGGGGGGLGRGEAVWLCLAISARMRKYF